MKNGKMMKWLLVGIAAFVAVFFIYKAVNIVANNYDTVPAESATVYDSVDAEAYVIRDETLLYNNDGGTVVSTAKNAEKVTADSPVALTFSSEAAAENYLELAYLNDLLEGYKKIDSQLVLANVDVDLLGEQTDEAFEKIVEAAYGGDLKQLSEKKLDYLVNISKRQISFGKKIDCAAMIETLSAKIAATERSAVPMSSINAGASGYYMSRPDGYEKTFTASLLESITPEKLKKAASAKPIEVSDNCVGKIVNGFNWYLVTEIETKVASRLYIGNEYTVILGNNASDKITAVVEALNKDKKGNTVVVLRCNDMTADRLSLRKVNAKIVFNEYTGLKVPKDAVRVIEDKDCVFVRVGKVTKKRFIKIIYTDKEFVICDPVAPAGNADYLKNHDAVILKG